MRGFDDCSTFGCLVLEVTWVTYGDMLLFGNLFPERCCKWGSCPKHEHRDDRDVLFLSQAHATCTLGFTLPSVHSAEPKNDAVVTVYRSMWETMTK
eukprot:s1209_g18.t1